MKYLCLTAEEENKLNDLSKCEWDSLRRGGSSLPWWPSGADARLFPLELSRALELRARSAFATTKSP
jgi:hypothetical protein